MGCHTVDQRVKLVTGNVDLRIRLAEQRDDSVAGVATNNRDFSVCRDFRAGQGGDKGLGANDIEGGDAKKSVRVEHASLLEHLGGNRDGRVDRVRDNEDKGIGGIVGNALDCACDDASVDLEQIITGHARLA